MTNKENEVSLETLQQIRSIMERSARFISLSGWSGIWAGTTALIGSYIAYQWLDDVSYIGRTYNDGNRGDYSDANIIKFIILAAILIIVAVSGAIFFTWRKMKRAGEPFWTSTSRKLVVQLMIPLLAGGVFSLGFVYHGHAMYVAPTFLIFYGLALLNGSKYSITDIRHLGLLEIILGSICIFVPGYGLLFWTIGFGVLNILYGIIMWNKYDKKESAA